MVLALLPGHRSSQPFPHPAHRLSSPCVVGGVQSWASLSECVLRLSSLSELLWRVLPSGPLPCSVFQFDCSRSASTRVYPLKYSLDPLCQRLSRLSCFSVNDDLNLPYCQLQFAVRRPRYALTLIGLLSTLTPLCFSIALAALSGRLKTIMATPRLFPSGP